MKFDLPFGYTYEQAEIFLGKVIPFVEEFGFYLRGDTFFYNLEEYEIIKRGTTTRVFKDILEDGRKISVPVKFMRYMDQKTNRELGKMIYPRITDLRFSPTQFKTFIASHYTGTPSDNFQSLYLLWNSDPDHFKLDKDKFLDLLRQLFNITGGNIY